MEDVNSTAKVLVEYGADPGHMINDACTPFYIACQTGFDATVKFFCGLANKCEFIQKPSSEGGTPLHVAAQKGHLTIVKILLNEVAVDPVTHRGGTPLYVAAGRGHLNIVKLLIEKGADVNVCFNGFSPLHIVCWQFAENSTDCLALIQVLLKAGADPLITDKQGKTCLDLAKERGAAKEILSVLSDAQVNYVEQQRSNRMNF